MPGAAKKTTAPKRAPRAKAKAAMPPTPRLQGPAASQPTGGSAVRSLARQLHSWTGSLIGGVGTAADLSLAMAAASVQRPGPKAAVAKATALLRDAREAAGLTLDDLRRMTAAAIGASFLSEPVRAQAHAALQSWADRHGDAASRPAG